MHATSCLRLKCVYKYPLQFNRIHVYIILMLPQTYCKFTNAYTILLKNMHTLEHMEHNMEREKTVIILFDIHSK
jgi:hypothetical protein